MDGSEVVFLSNQLHGQDVIKNAIFWSLFQKSTHFPIQEYIIKDDYGLYRPQF